MTILEVFWWKQSTVKQQLPAKSANSCRIIAIIAIKTGRNFAGAFCIITIVHQKYPSDMFFLRKGSNLLCAA